jgi:hypothetical protein
MWYGVFRIATLNMETAHFSETIVKFCQIIRRHFPEHDDLQNATVRTLTVSTHTMTVIVSITS